MGWMGGLGRGMLGYSKILQDKEKRDWQAKQDEVAFQRQLNLENLRKQNNMEIQDRGWAREDEVTARKQEYEEGRQVVGKLNGVDVTKAEFDRLTPEQRNKMKTLDEYEIGVATDKARAVSDVEMDNFRKKLQIQEEERQRGLQTLMNSDEFSKLPPEKQSMAKLMGSLGGDAKSMLSLFKAEKDGKLSAPTEAHLTQAVELVDGLQEQSGIKFSPEVRFALIQTKSTEMANPGMATSGKRSYEDKPQLIEKMAQDMIDKKISVVELMELSPSTKQLVFEKMIEIAQDDDDTNDWFSLPESAPTFSKPLASEGLQGMPTKENPRGFLQMNMNRLSQ